LREFQFTTLLSVLAAAQSINYDRQTALGALFSSKFHFGKQLVNGCASNPKDLGSTRLISADCFQNPQDMTLL